MIRKSISIAGLVVLSALLLAAAGCGGKKKEAGATQTSLPPLTVTTDAMTSTEMETETEGASGASGSGGSGTSADCKEFASAAADVQAQFGQALSGSGDVDLQKAADAFDALTNRAPSDVRSDFQTIDDAFQKLAVALKGVDLSGGKRPDAATLAKLAKLSTEINQAKLTAAANHISRWSAQNC